MRHSLAGPLRRARLANRSGRLGERDPPAGKIRPPAPHGTVAMAIRAGGIAEPEYRLTVDGIADNLCGGGATLNDKNAKHENGDEEVAH